MTTEFAQFLRHQPRAVARLLDRHVDDGSGRCRVCVSGGQTGNLRWPCTTYAAAARAAALIIVVAAK